MKLLEHLLSTPASELVEHEKENSYPNIVTSVTSVPPQLAKPSESGGHCPGPDRCAGCYSVGILDGLERFIHPPRASAEWEEWLSRWQPSGRTR